MILISNEVRFFNWCVCCLRVGQLARANRMETIKVISCSPVRKAAASFYQPVNSQSLDYHARLVLVTTIAKHTKPTRLHPVTLIRITARVLSAFCPGRQSPVLQRCSASVRESVSCRVMPSDGEAYASVDPYPTGPLLKCLWGFYWWVKHNQNLGAQLWVIVYSRNGL